jgi:hypothetical protein
MHHLQENGIMTSPINSQLWKSQQVKLYNRIQTFNIDQPGDSFPFSKRLARDHQWSLIYAQRVIEEYKKFLFLAIVADYPVTPSNAVDQAWHLHLTYTHSYWNDLCIHILPRPLHHTPTQGGQQQRDLFWDYYRKTLESYECFFGNCAPIDIWPAPATRFRQTAQFRQVNSQDYWVIPKPHFPRFQRVPWKISLRPWFRNAMITLLVIGLVFSLTFLSHSAIAVDLDLINLNLIVNQILQPIFSQVPSTPNSDLPIDSEVKLAQFFEWILKGIGGLMAIGLLALHISAPIFAVVFSLMISQCPECKRFWRLETTTHVLREPTEEIEGEELVIILCKCCHYTQERHKATHMKLNETDSHSGCACGI